jgi:hypothetical protein
MQMKAIGVSGPGLIVGIALQRFDLPIFDKKEKSGACEPNSVTRLGMIQISAAGRSLPLRGDPTVPGSQSHRPERLLC